MSIKPGVIVMWDSQASGVFKIKRGKVLGIVNPEEDAYEYVPPELRTKHSRVKGQRFSSIKRVAVEVPRENGRGCDYYFPRFSIIKKVL